MTVAEKTQLKPKNKFDLLYHGCDGLEISFAGGFPSYILDQFAKAKAEAKKNDDFVTVPITNTRGESVLLQVKQHGAKGGYTYTFSTEDDQNWAIKKANGINSIEYSRKTPEEQKQLLDRNWNIRAVVTGTGAFGKSIDDIEASLYKLLTTLDANVYGEAIGRFDYAHDYYIEDFELSPFNFVVPHQTKKTSTGNDEKADTGLIQDRMKARKYVYTSAGCRPNFQNVIYDKRGEVISKNKDFYWNAWGLDKDDEDLRYKIWRFETRVFKDKLKDWSIRGFKDLKEKQGDLLKFCMERYRYIDNPEQDSNISRCDNHEVWQDMIDNIQRVYDVNGYKPENLKQEITAIKANMLSKQMVGLAINACYLQGMDNIELLDTHVRNILHEYIQNNQQTIQDKFVKVKERYFDRHILTDVEVLEDA